MSRNLYEYMVYYKVLRIKQQVEVLNMDFIDFVKTNIPGNRGVVRERAHGGETKKDWSGDFSQGTVRGGRYNLTAGWCGRGGPRLSPAFP